MRMKRFIAPVLLVALGSILRVLWSYDFEWKYDEKWMFDRALRIADGRSHFPMIGMASGAGLRNPGASIWPFGILAHVTPDPHGMTLAIMLANVLALWGFALWVWRAWRPEDRERGLWGVGLFAVSPLPVLFSRKIWAQDLLPVLLVPWLWGHTKRKLFWGAFLWGAFGAALGQIHMSGFFAALALVLATVILDRRGVRWVGWFAGSCVASVPLLPWIKFTLSPGAPGVGEKFRVSLRFFWDALLNAFGLGIHYSIKDELILYLRGPEIFGVSTYLVAAAHVLLAISVLAAFYFAIRDRIWVSLSFDLRIYALAVIACGLSMHVIGLKVVPHYLIVWSPLLQVFVAWALASSALWLRAVCGLQAFVTFTFLLFIHVNGGAPESDFGIPYSAQSDAERKDIGKPRMLDVRDAQREAAGTK